MENDVFSHLEPYGNAALNIENSFACTRHGWVSISVCECDKVLEKVHENVNGVLC